MYLVQKKPWAYFLVVVVYILPYIFLGENVYIPITDNLDSNFVWIHSIIANHALFSPNDQLIDGMIGLQPRAVYSSEWNLPLLLSYGFGSLAGYLVNFILIHLLAFLGMWGLLQYVKKLALFDCPDYLIGLISVFFALIKFWPYAGISAAGIPIVIWGILLVDKNQQNIRGYGLIALYIFYSSLIFSGIFVCFAYFIYCIYLASKKSWPKLKTHLLVLMGISVFYILMEYRLVYAIFGLNGFTSHREEMQSEYFSYSISNISIIKEFFISGQWHAGAYSYLAPLLVLFSIVFALIRGEKSINKRFLILSSGLMLCTLLLSFFFRLNIITSILSSIPIVKSVQLDRFYVFLPFALTFLLFTFLYFIKSNFKRKSLKLLIIISLGLCIIGNFRLDENWRILVFSKHQKNKLPNYKEFYAFDQFKEVKSYLDAVDSSYRVGCIGLHPAVLVKNNIKVVDGYLANYNLKSKQKLQTVIKNEIAKDENLQNYFNLWGNRAYLFNDILKKDFEVYRYKSELSKIDSHLEFNYHALKALSCNYLISAVPINISLNSNLKLEKVFDSKDSFWIIYLYKIL